MGFERTEEGREVSLRHAALLKGFSSASRFWKANLSPYNFVKKCMVLSHSCCSLDEFSHATSSISVKFALSYMFSTYRITFSSSVHGTLIGMHSAALQVSLHVYFVMWRLGVSDHGVHRADLASSFSWF